MAALLLLCLFVGLPFVEILTFIEVGGRIGGLATIGATIITALIGAALFRYQGMNTLARAQTSLAEGRMPLEEVVGGLGLLLAAICLFVPGFVTDVIGFLLFVPPIRIVVLGIMLRPVLAKAKVGMSSRGFGPTTEPFSQNGRTIDGEYRDISESDPDHPIITKVISNDREDDTKPRTGEKS
jgi:UPF0716 protein FxsA